MNDLKVNVSKTVNAPIKKVFDAWLNPTMLSKFILPMPGMENPQVENNAKEGGDFTILMKVGENEVPHKGKYLEIDSPNKLAFTWESPESVDDSVVTLNFIALDDEKTQVNLEHVKFIDETRRSNHEGGWSNILTKLSDVVAA